jgi:hypothetical protein
MTLAASTALHIAAILLLYAAQVPLNWRQFNDPSHPTFETHYGTAFGDSTTTYGEYPRPTPPMQF